MILHNDTCINERKDENKGKTNITFRFFVKGKIGYIEEKRTKMRSIGMRMKVMVCIQYVVANKKFEIEYEYGQSKYMSSGFCTATLD